MLLLEHGPQKTLPQLRQWCLRFVNVKAVRQRMQTSESDHSGGYDIMLATEACLEYRMLTALLSSILLAMFSLGGKW
jgi:hypothetical protein